MLIPLVASHTPKDLRKFLEGQGPLVFSLKFVPYFNEIIEIVDEYIKTCSQDNSYLDSIGMESKCSISNYIHLGILIVLFTFLLVIFGVAGVRFEIIRGFFKEKFKIS
jgi:hypothetical protein